MSLVKACQANERWAWRRLVDGWAAPIFRWCVFLGLNARDAEDGVQDVFATAAQRIDRCSCDEVLGSWLYQITRRHAANRRRLAWCRRVLLIEDDVEPAFDDHPSLDDSIQVRAVLAKMPMGYVEVLLLMDIEGFTRREAATILDLKEPAVASRLRRARQAFRDASTSPLAELERSV